jgi:TRAP-type transport system periplasmic protein
MRKICVLAAVLSAVVGLGSLSGLTIKIGTVAPAGSPWDDVLRHIASQWATLSGGRVTLRIYAGGSAGGESDMIRKMRFGQLQGAALTQLALGELDPDILALDVPFLITSQGEFDYVLAKSRPYFEQQFQKAGYKMLTWAGAGWVHFFATKPINTPAELRRLRMGVPEGDEELLAVWKNLGFNVVSLPIPDIMAGLQSGLVDAFYSPPSAAAVFQWFSSAGHMSALKVVPVIVGLVIDEKTWNKIPAELQQPLAAAVLSDEQDLARIGDELDTQAIDAMVSEGLTIDPVSPAAASEWQALGKEGARQVIGSLIPRSIYDKIVGYLGEYQSAHPAGAAK